MSEEPFFQPLEGPLHLKHGIVFTGRVLVDERTIGGFAGHEFAFGGVRYRVRDVERIKIARDWGMPGDGIGFLVDAA